MYEKEIQEILKSLLQGKGSTGRNIDINIEKLITLSLKQMSVGYDSALYLAGYRSGESFVQGLGIRDESGLKKNLELMFNRSGMGDAEISGNNPVILKVKKSSTCYGIQSSQKPVCFFKAGFFAGAVSSIKGKKVPCVEKKCHAKGDDHCEFEINVQ
jgi:predicted hydrocarbon binding protein